MYFVHHVVSQTDGPTPLLIASQNGHVECVRALLDRGAEVNQAMVGCASLKSSHFAGFVRGEFSEPACAHQ